MYENGIIEEGYFKNGKLEGECRIISSYGGWCTWNFNNGIKNGDWTQQLKDGTICEAKYSRGKLYGVATTQYPGGFTYTSWHDDYAYNKDS